MVEEIQRRRTDFPTFEPQAIFSTDPKYYGERSINYPEHYNPDFRTQGQADQFDYGYAQMMNPQGGARQVGRWLTDSDALNPDVFERQAGSSSYPGAARNLAQMLNREEVGILESPKQYRDVLNYLNEFDPDSFDPMYSDIYSIDDDFPEFTPEMYTSKREQIEDEENSFVANLMDMYGRDNPFLQELGGTTTEIDPYGGTTEEYTDLGYEHLDPVDLATRSARGKGDRAGTRPRQYIPNTMPGDRAGDVFSGIPYNMPGDRAGEFGSITGGLVPPNIGFARAGAEPALPPSDIGYNRAGPVPALPPEDIGFDRAGWNLGIGSLPPSDIGSDRGPEKSNWWDKLPWWLRGGAGGF